MRIPRLTLATAALVVAIFILPGAGESLDWHRDDSGMTSWVTALTAHLTHWNLPHLGFDLLAWLVLGSMVETHSRRLWGWTVGLAAGLVSLFVFLAAPEITIYRGLSGIDSALFIASAITIHTRAKLRGDHLMGLIALGCILTITGKIIWEWTTGTPLFARGGGFTAVPQAHLAGAVAGWIAVWVTRKKPPGPSARIHLQTTRFPSSNAKGSRRAPSTGIAAATTWCDRESVIQWAQIARLHNL